jgi:DNA-binding response OmpR family regulator
VRTFRPCLLILDVLMPQLDGIGVCRRLKANAETLGIKILGIAGFPGNIPTLIEAGADACVAKPLDFGLVGQEIERLLASIEA